MGMLSTVVVEKVAEDVNVGVDAEDVNVGIAAPAAVTAVATPAEDVAEQKRRWKEEMAKKRAKERARTQTRRGAAARPGVVAAPSHEDNHGDIANAL